MGLMNLFTQFGGFLKSGYPKLSNINFVITHQPFLGFPISRDANFITNDTHRSLGLLSGPHRTIHRDEAFIAGGF